ncbi:MAG: MarR family transcriptional regulator [Spirochaetota bacterium]
MAQKHSAKLPGDYKNLKNEAIASLYWTGTLLKKVSKRFFSPYISSEAQFNILVLLKDSETLLTQRELSEKLIVDKSNITGMIDRMQSSGLLQRLPHKEDKRSYYIELTEQGRKLAKELDILYLEKINQVMATFSEEEIRQYIGFNEKIRQGLLSL